MGPEDHSSMASTISASPVSKAAASIPPYPYACHSSTSRSSSSPRLISLSASVKPSRCGFPTSRTQRVPAASAVIPRPAHSMTLGGTLEEAATARNTPSDTEFRTAIARAPPDRSFSATRQPSSLTSYSLHIQGSDHGYAVAYGLPLCSDPPLGDISYVDPCVFCCGLPCASLADVAASAQVTATSGRGDALRRSEHPHRTIRGLDDAAPANGPVGRAGLRCGRRGRPVGPSHQ